MRCSRAWASSVQPPLGGSSGATTSSKQEYFTLSLQENIFGKTMLNSHISAEFTHQSGQVADGNQMQQLSSPPRDTDDPDFAGLLPRREQRCLGWYRWWPWESSTWCLSSKNLIQQQPCGPASAWQLCVVLQSLGAGLRQLWRAEPDHSWVRRWWAGSPEVDVLLSTGHEVLSYPKVCCSSTGYLILGDSLVTPVITSDGHPEESGLSSLAAMWSQQIWYCPEQQTLSAPQKKKRVLQITHQILCQFVPRRRNMETNC